MKVTIETPEEIPKEFLDFIQVVSGRENLNDWELIIWDIKGEAECITDMKLIYVAVKPDTEMMKAWFLHEVAHATFERSGGAWGDSYWHRKLWKVELLRLLNCYIPNITQKTSLWLKGLE